MDGSWTNLRKRIAVIGSGVSGLSAAWHLSRDHDVVLYEAEARPGGHSNTLTISGRSGSIPVDTGFIVFNDHSYPNLVAMFRHLGVASRASDMSFSASLRGGRFEYNGGSPAGMIAQRSNLLRPRFWRMMRDILRFYREAPAVLTDPRWQDVSLGDYLDRNGYSAAMVEDHLLPMGAAIWSTTAEEMRAHPIRAFVRFCQNHGLIQIKGRPKWRTVIGGSRAYVRALLDDFAGELRLATPVARVQRDPMGVTVTCAHGRSDRFDEVLIATHADQALRMLADPSAEERDILGAFRYTKNRAVLHTDATLMPQRRRAWAAWNYIGGGDGPLCVTYWMNRLQGLDTDQQVFVTLNPARDIAADKILADIDYAHPLFDAAAMDAQQRIWSLQGQRRTWFAGAHFGSGFHEDGLQAGLAAAEALGGRPRPWIVPNPSGRIFVTPAAAPVAVAAE